MSEISAEQWQKIEALFSAALDCAPTMREEFLQQQCRNDQELLEMVRSLLALNEEAADFIATPAFSMVFGEPLPSPAPVNRAARLKRSRSFQQLLCLGAGSNGEAYKAIDLRNNSIVVLKTLSRAINSAHFRAQFDALSRCRHPNLGKPQDLFANDEELFFTRSFIEGVNIKSYAASHSPAALRAVFRQAASALVELHQAGLLHENLKPTNMFVESDGKLIITDYGLAPDCRGGIYRGSPNDESVKYLAPEQCQGRAATPASDWYSFGVILYETLTGNAPFLGSFFEVALAKRRFRAPAPKTIVPTIPIELDQLCQLLLHSDIKQRPQSEEILKRLHHD